MGAGATPSLRVRPLEDESVPFPPPVEVSTLDFSNVEEWCFIGLPLHGPSRWVDSSRQRPESIFRLTQTESLERINF
jgi:hypothetical protein